MTNEDDTHRQADSDSAIVVRNLSRRFGAVTAVDDISLDVPRGSFFGFLGPNGAGKSTTVRMLSGLLAPDTGQALIDGYSILEQPVEVKRRIGVIPDELALFSRLSIWEHLTMIGGVYGLSTAASAQGDALPSVRSHRTG